MLRACDCCGESYEAKRPNSRFLSASHRQAYARGKRPDTAAPAVAPKSDRNTDIADRLRRELETLGVDGQYEAAVVVGLAQQLDSKTVTGAAYVSLSKEVDRRVDALRLKADRPDDPVRLILSAVEEKQTHLRAVQ